MTSLLVQTSVKGIYVFGCYNGVREAIPHIDNSVCKKSSSWFQFYIGFSLASVNVLLLCCWYLEWIRWRLLFHHISCSKFCRSQSCPLVVFGILTLVILSASVFRRMIVLSNTVPSIFVALLWTFSIASMSFFRYGFQIHRPIQQFYKTKLQLVKLRKLYTLYIKIICKWIKQLLPFLVHLTQKDHVSIFITLRPSSSVVYTLFMSQSSPRPLDQLELLLIGMFSRRSTLCFSWSEVHKRNKRIKRVALSFQPMLVILFYLYTKMYAPYKNP